MESVDSVATGVGTKHLDVFVFNQGNGLQKGLADIAESTSSLWLDKALGRYAEHIGKGTGETASRYIRIWEKFGQLMAESRSSDGFGFFAGVEMTEMRVVCATRSSAAAAIGKSEGTQRRTVFG